MFQARVAVAKRLRPRSHHSLWRSQTSFPTRGLPREEAPNFAFVFVQQAPAAGIAAPSAAPVVETPPVAPVEELKPVEQPFSLFVWLAGIYGAIASVLLFRLFVGHLGLARLWRAARPAPIRAERLFKELAATTCPRAELRVSRRVGGPVCFGVIRPRVLVPISLIAAGDVSARDRSSLTN